jgi:N-acylneuraminate cytidylyltransferase/CMP-N,N'-diacetyllegionaminic acid synthase
MHKGHSVLGIIPARGGSKGLRNKNIMPLNGKPLISYTVRSAKASGIFDRLMVTTDSEAIAKVAKRSGAEVPFLRPKRLATDTALAIDVIHHALGWLERNDRDRHYDLVFYLQPTSPLRIPEDYKRSVDLLIKRKADSVLGVCEARPSPMWSNVLPSNGSLGRFLKRSAVNKNRQELPTYYRINGAIYLAKYSFIKRSSSWIGKRSYAYLMPYERSIDIDDEMDMALAKHIMKKGF